jgi:hypothetical protein
MRRPFACVPVVLACCAACSAPQAPAPSQAPPPYRTVADVKTLMQTVIDPNADVIWGAVGTIETKAGTLEKFPKTDEEWALVRNAAYTVSEAGNLLMLGDRPKEPRDQWMKLSRELIEVGQRAIKAAEARDKDAIFSVGGEVYDACSNCHQKYLVAIVEANK